jgi:hypothetical protein
MGTSLKSSSVLTIGETTHVPGWVEIEFLDNRSTHDFDVVIWDPNGFCAAPPAQFGAPFDSAQVLSALDRRFKEFETFLVFGGVLIVFANPEYRVPLSTKGYFEESDNTDGWAAFPYDTPVLSAAHGTQIQVHGQTPLAGFLREYQRLIAYTAGIDDVPEGGSVLATAGKTSMAVGVVVEYINGGRLVILPEMKRDFQGTGEDAYEVNVEASKTFYTSLVRATQHATKEPAPKWVDSISTPAEHTVKERHQKASAALRDAEVDLAAVETEQAAIDADKILLYGSGDSLAEQCSSIFERFGAKRLPAPERRADLRFEYQDKILVMEIKGLSKSAKEENAAQLEKWVMEELTSGTEFGRIKAFLVVNAYRHKPLNERAVPFPTQMIPMSTQREHALLTTTQLFVLAAQVAESTITAQDAMALLISTVGVLDGLEDDQLMVPS